MANGPGAWYAECETVSIMFENNNLVLALNFFMERSIFCITSLFKNLLV